jgi:hypothetical protein
MKKLSMLLASVCLCASAFAQTATSIVFTWSNTDSSVPACSSSVTVNCLVGQTITDVTVAASPVVLSSSISPTATTYTTPLPAFTTTSRAYTLVVNYKDANGKAQATAPAACGNGSAAPCSVSVPLVVNPPTGFTVTTQ